MKRLPGTYCAQICGSDPRTNQFIIIHLQNLSHTSPSKSTYQSSFRRRFNLSRARSRPELGKDRKRRSAWQKQRADRTFGDKSVDLWAADVADAYMLEWCVWRWTLTNCGMERERRLQDREEDDEGRISGRISGRGEAGPSHVVGMQGARGGLGRGIILTGGIPFLMGEEGMLQLAGREGQSRQTCRAATMISEKFVFKRIGLLDGDKASNSRPAAKFLHQITTPDSRELHLPAPPSSELHHELENCGFQGSHAAGQARAIQKHSRLITAAENLYNDHSLEGLVDITVRLCNRGNQPWNLTKKSMRTILIVRDNLKGGRKVPKIRHLDDLFSKNQHQEKPVVQAVTGTRTRTRTRTTRQRSKRKVGSGFVASGGEGRSFPSWLSFRRKIHRRKRRFVPGGVSDSHIEALLDSLSQRSLNSIASSLRRKKTTSNSLPPCAGEEKQISESNEKCQQQNQVLVASNMVTQSFAFREPVSDLGQGVFPAPDMLPRKQMAYLLQGESVISPPTPEKPQKRRRNSMFQQIFPPDYQNEYVSQLPNGRLSKGSFQGDLEPCLTTAGNSLCDMGIHSLPVNRGDMFARDLQRNLQSTRFHSNTQPLDFHVPGVSLSGRMAGSNISSAMASSCDNISSNYSIPHSFEPDTTDNYIAHFQSLVNQGGLERMNGYIGSGRQAEISQHAEADFPSLNTSEGISGVQTTAPPLTTLPNFSSPATPPTDVLGSGRNGSNTRRAFAQSFVQPYDRSFQSNEQMSLQGLPNMQDANWDLLSQASVSNSSQTLHHPSAELPTRLPATGQTVPPIPQYEPRNSEGFSSLENYYMSNLEPAITPEKNHEGHRSSYVLTPEQTPSIYHSFDATTPHAGTHLRPYFPELSPTLETTQATGESAVSEIIGANQEDVQLGGLSRSREPLLIPPEIENGRKEGYTFDLNEVPGAQETPSKVRKKYTPRVAKDKRPYRRRTGKVDNQENKTVGGNLEKAPSRHGTGKVDVNADLRGTYTNPFVVNAEGGDSSNPGDFTVDLGHKGVGFTPVTPVPFESVNTWYTREGQSTPEEAHPNSLSICMGHNIAVCDCEACMKHRCMQRRNERQDKQCHSSSLGGAQVVQSSLWEQENSEVASAGGFYSYAEVSLNGRGREERSSVDFSNDGTEVRESFVHSSLDTDRMSSFHSQWPVRTASILASAVNTFKQSAKRMDLSFMGQSSAENHLGTKQSAFKRIQLLQSQSSKKTKRNAFDSYNAKGDSLVSEESLSAQSPLMQAYQCTESSGRNSIGSLHSNTARPVRRSLQFDAPAERSLSSFPSTGPGEYNEVDTRRSRSYRNDHSSATVTPQDAYPGVGSYFEERSMSHLPRARNSCLQQFSEAASDMGHFRENYYGTEIVRIEEMVNRNTSNHLFTEQRTFSMHQMDPHMAGLSNDNIGTIVPVQSRYEWNPEFPTRAYPKTKSFLDRLCPRGLIAPQPTPFRMMDDFQRILYLKNVVTAPNFQMSPTELYHHVSEHLEEEEKENFKGLWQLVMHPLSEDQLRQFMDCIQPHTMQKNAAEKTVGKSKAKAKRASKKSLQIVQAMTLWPDLVHKSSKKGKEKDRQEQQNSNCNPENLQLVPYQSKTMIPYEGPFLPIRKRKPRPKVVLDNETVRVWKLLMGRTGPMDDETDSSKEIKWDEERRIMKAQAETFISRMHLVQGDRSFSRWKGSVVDSVVGAFLTQNVNDVLSSSAFMCIRARFPGRGFRGPLQSKAPEDDINTPLENGCSEAGPPPLGRLREQNFEGSQEASSSGAPSEQVMSLESRSVALESLESHNEGRRYTDLEVRHQEVTSWTEAEQGTRPWDLQQQQVTSIHTELSQTTVNQTTSVEVSEPTEAMNLRMTAITEHNWMEESSSANIDNQLDALSLREDGNVPRVSATENDVGSELVAGVEQSKGRYNPKGLTGPERARLEAQQISARKAFDWEALRGEFDPVCIGRAAEEKVEPVPRTLMTEDGVDWEAVRQADVEEVAAVIKERGMNWILAGRIKAFLERLRINHGAIDLEWLRSIPTDDTKEFLLSVRGLGLKSVECIRLLTLHHLAFPVDTNVGRICVRLGWVPLEPLPEELQLHLLELYPVQATIQKYLWPRLCTLDQQTLYELHYQMITFGKVFCTKSKPNCNACPMKSDCKHFASALASARLALPASERPVTGPTLALPPGTSSVGDSGKEGSDKQTSRAVSQYCEPIVEEPMTPESDADVSDYDIEDYPFAVEVEEESFVKMYIQDTNAGRVGQQVDIPNCCNVSNPSVTVTDSEPVQEVNMENWGSLLLNSQTSQFDLIQANTQNTTITVVETEEILETSGVSQSTEVLVQNAPSQELVLLPPEAASIPVPKLKNISRLRTVHYVYELPDTHPLLEGVDKREADDPCTYLLAIWGPGEVPESIPNINDCNVEENPYASTTYESEAKSIKATLLVPCRTAMQGSFPLNGTYFQVNEVFADHASSLQPIVVPRTLLWNLRRRFVFFGTSVTSIFRGMTVEEIQACFWRGYVCVRGFDRTSRAPKPLVGRLHLQATKSPGKGTPMDA